MTPRREPLMQTQDTTMSASAFETPFLGTEVPVTVEQPKARDAFEGFMSAAERESPFLPEYWTPEGMGDVVSPATSELVELLEQLWDQEFDELTQELADEAAAAVDARLPVGETADPGARERFVRGWLDPLRQEAERLFETVADRVGEADAMAMGEAEFEALLEPLEVPQTDLPSLFEDFLGGLLKKAKKLAKGAWKIAKKGIAAVGSVLPIAILLRKLKPLVKPLLERVLRYALGKLPPALRPAASQLAKRLLGATGLDGTTAAAAQSPAGAQPTATEPQPAATEPDPAAPEPEPAATADGDVVQQEFDLAAASLLFAADETDAEIALAEIAMEAQSFDGEGAEQLDDARRRFVSELSQIGDNEDPTAAIQNFLPAIMPIAKVAIGIVGRDRIIRFLAPFLAKLIARYTGPQSSEPLARAIADAGLRLMGLEVAAEEEDGRTASAEALAATIEDTVHRLAEFHELELENEDALAEQAYAAFQAAAVANMPPATLHSDLRPTGALAGTWMPRTRCRAKRYSRPLETTITPQIARHLTTFGGETLMDALGTDGTVTATAQLYEAIPGTTLAGLAAQEDFNADELHPLSTEAAGLLFGEPELGRDVSPAYRADPSHIAVGQRFARLAVPGAMPRHRHRHGRRRKRSVHATIDVRRGRAAIRVRLYLSEAAAQRLATEVNRGANAVAIVAALRTSMDRRVLALLSGRTRRHVRVVVDGGLPRPQPDWLQRLNALVPAFAPSVGSWTFKALAAHPELGQQIVAAARSERSGIRIVVSLKHIAGLEAAAAAVARGGTPPALGAPAQSSVRVLPGYRR